jgi:hypothetical protein
VDMDDRFRGLMRFGVLGGGDDIFDDGIITFQLS